jgi:aminopeptidase
MTDKMKQAATGALKGVLNLSATEKLLVITDDERLEIGRAFAAGAEALGAAFDLYCLPADQRPLSEVPEHLAKLSKGAQVTVNCFGAMADETPFRINLIRGLLAAGQRVGHAPGITESMMSDGPLNVDFADLRHKASAMIARLRESSYLRVTAPGGTDATFYVEGRGWDTDLVIGPGQFGNLPCGEIWCAPVETLGEGIVVCDGSIGDLGAVPSPVTIVVDRGRVQSVACDDADFGARVEQLLAIDDEAKIIGEFGIGINPQARITGNLLEDEKAFRTAHVAFGNNEEMPGGKNRSRTHRDFLFREPNITVHYVDGSAAQIVEAGLANY